MSSSARDRRTSFSAFTQDELWTVSSKASEIHVAYGPLEKLSSGSGLGSKKRWQRKYFYLQDRFGYADDRETSSLKKWVDLLDIEYPVQKPLDREFAVLRKSERPTEYYYVQFEEAGTKPKKVLREDITPLTDETIGPSQRLPAGTRVMAPQKKVKSNWGRNSMTQNLAVVLHGELYEPLRIRAVDAETANLWVNKINKRIEQEIKAAKFSGGSALAAREAHAENAIQTARHASTLTQEAFVAGTAFQMASHRASNVALDERDALGEFAPRGEGVARHGGGAPDKSDELETVRRISAQAEEVYKNEIRRLSGHDTSLSQIVAQFHGEETSPARVANAAAATAPPVPPPPAERRPSHNLNARVTQLEQKVLGKDGDISTGLPARLAEIERAVYGQSKDASADSGTLLARVSALELDYFG
eukprot:g1458.t1